MRCLSYRIIFEALSHEIVYEYVRSAKLKGQTPTYESFCLWEKEASKDNQTLQFVLDFTFTTLHSLHLFRCGTRMCDDQVTLASRNKMGALFYISHHPKYQQILCADTLYLLSLNPEARKKISIESAKTQTGTIG